jgi:hypothetical protein
MIPWLRDYPFPWLKRFFGWTPLFSGRSTAVHARRRNYYCRYDFADHHFGLARDFAQCSGLATEAAYGLGATRWEATAFAVLSYAKKGCSAQ